MKKLLLLLPLLLLGAGCKNTEPNLGVSLKVPKERILTYNVVHYGEYIEKTPILGSMLGATSTTSTKFTEKVIPAKDEVEYNYISSDVAKAKPYWDKEGNPVSSAEYLPSNNGKEVVAFYAKPKFYRDYNVVYDIKSATATLQDFQRLTALTFKDKIRSLFVGVAVATSTFNVSSTYNPGDPGTVEVLIVGGGGGGGQTVGGGGGGGGGGGLTTTIGYAVVSQPYTVTVGAGGLGGKSNGVAGVTGSTSTFDTISVAGGGGGGAWNTTAGRNGASGGGGSYSLGAGTGIVGQGFAGGTCPSYLTNESGGGGGGAGGAGGNCGAGVGDVGIGGVGITSTISGSAVGYAGGGGSGAGDPGASHNGGTASHGGGQGGAEPDGAGSNATANTGGGGGGGGGGASPGNGGNGADGVVIIAFTASGSGAATTVSGTCINFSQK